MSEFAKAPNQWTLSQEDAGRLALEVADLLDSLAAELAEARKENERLKELSLNAYTDGWYAGGYAEGR
jgi:hypothetical protein